MKVRWNWALLEKPLGNLCKRYARIVALYPIPFIVVPIIVTAVLSTGVAKLKIFRNVDYLFAPLDARWKYEEQVFHDLWAKTDEMFYPGNYCFVISTSRSSWAACSHALNSESK